MTNWASKGCCLASGWVSVASRVGPIAECNSAPHPPRDDDEAMITRWQAGRYRRGRRDRE